MSEIKLIKFKLNQNPLIAKKLDINETLFQIRKKLEEKLPANSIFTFRDGTIIEQEDEKSFTLQDIIEKVNNFYELHILLEEGQEENELKQVKKMTNKIPKKKITKIVMHACLLG